MAIQNTALFATYRRRLLMGLSGALVLRLFIILLPLGFWVDIDTFQAWARRMAEIGPWGFYSEGYFCDYPPIYLYVLGALAKLHHLWDPNWQMMGHGFGFVTLIKLPAVLADLATSYLIFRILAGRATIRSAYHAALAYAFNPVPLFVSGVWGQIDSVLTMLMIGVVYLLVTNRAVLAGLLGCAAVLVKPQGIFLAPFFVLSQWFRRPWWIWPVVLMGGVALAWGVTAPFAPQHTVIGPLSFLYDRMSATAGNYTSSTINAMNVWAPTSLDNGTLMWGGPTYTDSRTILGIPHRWMGLGFLVVLLAWSGIFLYRKRNEGVGPQFLVAAMLMLGMFLFPTRMHERYIFPAIAFLTLAAGTNRYLQANLWGFTSTACFNILYVYVYYGNAAVFNAIPAPLRSLLVMACVLANMWFFGDLLGYTFAQREPHRKPNLSLARALLGAQGVEKAPDVPDSWGKRDWAWLGGLMGGFFGLGLWRLGTPNERIFDEVYHARTALEYLKGINPYEWTHPPLAKLMIAGGLAALGDNGWGWRIMSLVMGTLTVGVFYLLARRMFATRRPAWIAALLLVSDGVFFVQSRVAMTNIFVLFFLMCATLAAWEFTRSGKERYVVLTALGLGASLATRWSSMYAWGLLGLLIAVWVLFFETPRRKPGQIAWLALRTLGYFVLIPIAVYLPCYIPYYGAHYDHWLPQVWELQKTMWGYHSHLNATHSYSSPCWQWPFMIRPTWYYYHDWKNNTISGIIALGNPAVWWASMPALLAMAYVAWRRRSWMGVFIVVMGLGMYLGWAIQPRPLLFMHYMLETIPFAALAMAYFMDRLWRHEDWEPIASSYLILTCGLFLFFYPLLSALPIPQAFYRMHIWFKTWI